MVNCRESKFRAWDDANNEHIYYTLDELIECINGCQGVDDGWERLFKLYRIHQHDTSISTTSEFTGLHDRKGVEIYEGDILHYVGHFYETRHNIANRGEQMLVEVDGTFPVEFTDNRGFQMYHKGIAYYKIYPHEVIVMGNIREHPELLKEEQI